MRGPSLYVHAVLESPVPSSRAPAGIEIMPVAGLFAAVERTTHQPVLCEESLRRQHGIVVALHRAARAVVPVRFGALVDADELTEVIRLRRAELGRALQGVRGREQMTIRVFGPRDAAGRHAGAAPSSGAEYLRQRAASARPVLTPGVERMIEAVATIAQAQTVDPGRGEIQVTIHHLIRRGLADRYRREATSSAATTEPALNIVISGPWPPFAFAPDIWSAGPASKPLGVRARQ